MPTADSADAHGLAHEIEVAFGPAMRGGWRESAALAPIMEDMAARGFRWLERGDIERAVVVFATVAGEILKRIDSISEDESEVGINVDYCMRGLAAGLEAADPTHRPRVIAAILETTIAGSPWNLGAKGRELLTSRTTTEERGELVSHLEARVPTIEGEWNRAWLGQLVGKLRGDDVQERIARARRSGDDRVLVDELLALHRPYEAARVLEQADPAQLEALVAVFNAHAYRDHAYRVIKRRVDDCPPPFVLVLLHWLLERTPERKKHRLDRARWAEALFMAEPTLERWAVLQQTVPFSRRTEIRRKLELRSHWRLVTQICIAENRHRWAVQRFRQIPEKTTEDWRMGAEIAQAIASDKPKLAANLWLGAAVHSVERGRVADGVGFALRGHDALADAKHPVLAKRHLALFRERTAGTGVEAELARRTHEGEVEDGGPGAQR